VQEEKKLNGKHKMNRTLQVMKRHKKEKRLKEMERYEKGRSLKETEDMKGKKTE
jgi:hypothetical protein